ncbi:MBL fold metallo-hydrolase [Paenibacillus sp. NPDC058071]|uniref:MBL fold metallo-hydrolase n=1 Tax=Paenibacillus sp. NPDC058071 TaxID=3346326 RepID=UPI0036DAE27D
MKMTKHQSIYQLTYLPNLFPVNCYLIEEEDGLTLIDAAMPGNAAAILNAASSIGKPIVRIVLTHAHSDHIGALDALKDKLPEAKVYISERDARLLRGDRTLDPAEGNLPIKGGVPKPGAIRTVPDTLLRGGDRIGSLLAVTAPGHTPGSIAFLDTRGGELIAGDAFQIRGGLAVSGQLQWRFPFPALATWNKQVALDSARKLKDLQPTLLAAGHGSWIHHPEERMNLAIAAAEARMAGASR